MIWVSHPKWDERPLLIVRGTPGAAVSANDVYASLAGRTVKWWTPDAIEFLEEIPHTATGKIRKTELRERFATTGGARPGSTVI